jgi:hypothetical protein
MWSAGERIYWLKAQPPTTGEKCASPSLIPVGANAFTTRPDGAWITLGIERGDATKPEFVDCIVFEISLTQQNLSDKRSRYAARTGALMLDLDKRWLDGLVTGPGRGGPLRARRELLGGVLPNEEVLRLPVRYLRVLYALPDRHDRRTLYEQAKRHIPLEAHEFVIARRQLRNPTRAVRRALARMSPYAHYI